MNDEKLIEGCIKGDRRCQNELYKKYFPLMSSIALRYTNSRDEAIQYLNSGFLKVLQGIAKYDKQFVLATYIRNVLINSIIDELRKNKTYLNVIQLSDYTETEVAYNQGEIDLEANEILEILNHLPEMTRHVFNLFAIEGFKHIEISKLLGISVNTSKWHVGDARKKLKELIESKKETKLPSDELKNQRYESN